MIEQEAPARHKTMRFRHRLYDMRYVIVPADSGRDQWGHVQKIQGIAAEFDNYFCDTSALQTKFRWDDDTREMVEKYLLTHSDFNKRGGRGFFLDVGQEIPSYYIAELGDAIKLDPFANITAPTPGAKLGCIVTVITPGGPAELCGREVVPNKRFCSLHIELDDDPAEGRVDEDAGMIEGRMSTAMTEPDPRDRQIAELNEKFEKVLAQMAQLTGVQAVEEDEPEMPAIRVPTQEG